ncbi:hypothetical protein B0H12DRAFT_165676 [Mycena haematopus]|nr:hypothetical protein B0H12DRAFT_165676 [Mycena haematopus]
MAGPRVEAPDAPIEGKIKVEQSTFRTKSESGLKVENLKLESSESATSEIAMLKALLKKKEKQALAREIDLEAKLFALNTENKRLKQKRVVDLAKIESLEADLKNLQVKREEHGEAILVLDSDDEEPETNNFGAADLADMQPSPAATPASSGTRSPARPGNGRPSRDAWSPVPDPVLPDATGDPLHSRDSDLVVQPKDEVIDVVIKKEGEPDQFERVTLIKSEDGKFDIWNVPSPNKEHAEAIPVLDSDHEEPGNNHPGAPDLSDMQPSPVAAPASSGTDSPT